MFMMSISFTYAQISSYDLKKGDVFDVNTVMEQNIEQDVMGQSVTIEQIMTTMETLEVMGFSDGLYKIKGTTQKMKIDMTIPMQGNQVMDSEGEGQMDDVTKALVGNDYFFYMDKYGQIERFEGLDEMSAAIMADLEKTAIGQMGQAESMTAFLNEDVIRATLSNLLSIYSPEGKKEWTSTSSAVINSLPTEIVSKRSFDGNNTILSAGELSVSGSTEQMGMTVSAEMSGTVNTIYDLMSNGMPSKVQVQQDAKGKASAQGMDIPMVVNVKSTSNITKR